MVAIDDVRNLRQSGKKKYMEYASYDTALRYTIYCLTYVFVYRNLIPLAMGSVKTFKPAVSHAHSIDIFSENSIVKIIYILKFRKTVIIIYETHKEIEKLILVGIESEREDIHTSLKELSELAKTAGAKCVGTLTQKRDRPHPKHYIGKGKLEELAQLIEDTEATGVLCDDELTSSQLRNMSEAVNATVLDRTTVILHIFAEHAHSAEGKVQVELAQLQYRLSHLSGIGVSLSRLGAGIGTRGPGETKLEMDRRYIKDRIDELGYAAGKIELHRQVARLKREKENIPVISMVGYTNAGKSTLLNALTNAGVLAEDKLFATLDTTTKRLDLPGGSEVLYTDTVGFINKLPHTLVKAFKATLEELNFADILVHVVDASSPARDEQIKTVNEALKQLNVSDKPIILVFNKMDKDVIEPLPTDANAINTVCLSAKQGTGTDQLLSAIEETLKSFRKEMTVLIPFNQSNLLSFIYGDCEILEESHTEHGTMIHGYFTEEAQNRLRDFAVSYRLF